MLEKLFLAFVYDTYQSENTADQLTKNTVQETKEVLEVIAYEKSLVTEPPKLFVEYIQFLQQHCIPILDSLNIFFYIHKAEKKKAILQEMMERKTSAQKVLFEIFLNQSYENIQKQLSRIFQTAGVTQSTIIIQSAKECSQNIKQEIRKHFPQSFVMFQVHRSLLGGLRIYKDGKLIDHSWLGKITTLQKLKIKN